MTIRLVGGPYDGAEGSLERPVSFPPEQIWVRPDPQLRGSTGLMYADRPKDGASKYLFDCAKRGVLLYEHVGSLKAAHNPMTLAVA